MDKMKVEVTHLQKYQQMRGNNSWPSSTLPTNKKGINKLQKRQGSTNET